MIEAIKKLSKILKSSDKKKLVIIFCLMLFASILEVMGISLILVFVSIISEPEKVFNIEWLTPIFSFLDIVNSKDLLIFGSIALIALFVFKNSFLVIFNYIQAKFVYNKFDRIANSLFKKYMYAPYTYHLGQNTAVLIRNVVTDTVLLTNQIMLPLLQISMEVVIVFGIFAYMFFLEPFITLMVLLLIGGTGITFLKIIKKRLEVHGKEAVEHRGQMIKKVNEGLGGIKEISIKNKQYWFIEEFHNSSRRFAKAQVFNQTIKKSSKSVIETAAIAGMLLVAILLIWQGREVIEVIPVLTLYGAASFKLIPSIDKISNNYNTLRYHKKVLDNIHNDYVNLQKNEQQIPEKESTSKIIPLNNKIEIDKIQFCYPDSPDLVLDNLSLQIDKGEVVGFVGTSGAGKTTIVDLILGLLKPAEGVVKVDNVDIRKNLPGWQKNIGYIPQFIFLSDNTIRNNIAFGVDEKKIDDNQVLEAVKMAQLEEMINDLPNELDTIVGERGVRLSGGQRQRIGIARALYSNPEILIMDEATSSLDNRTEKYIIESVERLKKDRTIIIVAHRLTTIKNCDKLFVVKQGTIQNSGTYNELLEKSEEFKAMVNSS